MKNLSHQQLQNEWERAAELAHENQSSQLLDRKTLDAAAGLRVQSGVKSGDWNVPNTYSCLVTPCCGA